ncbi:MAG: hypothetical protein Q9176_003600 [Flavoplaca citrina]
MRTESFHAKFTLDAYNNLRTTLDVGPCQTAIEDFMTLVEKDDIYLLTNKGRKPMDDFRATVRVTMSGPTRRCGHPEGNCLYYILTDVDRPPTRVGRHILTTEQDFLRSRQKVQARTLFIGGFTKDDIFLEDEEEFDILTGELDSEFFFGQQTSSLDQLNCNNLALALRNAPPGKET